MRAFWGLCIFLLLNACCGDAKKPDRVATRRLTQMSTDPLGKEDSFLSLTAREQSSWSFDNGLTINQTQEKLQSFETQPIVDVRLVGFDGEGNGKVILEGEQLIWHLQALQPAIPNVVLQQVKERIWAHRELGLQNRVLFHVSKANKNTCKAVHEAIYAAVQKEKEEKNLTGDDLVVIPYEVVDDLVRSDVEKLKLMQAIYVLNPKPVWSNYAYSYEERGGCAGTLWTARERYMWIDLTAGPVDYGPTDSGHGRVLPHSFPKMQQYTDYSRSKAVVPDLAALVHSATKHLIVPPSINLYLNDWLELVIQVVHLHDTLVPAKASKDLKEFETISEELQALKLNGQQISINHFNVAFGHCDACVAAYSRALQTRTYRIPIPGSPVSSSTFLDSPTLYAWMSDPVFLATLTDNGGNKIQTASKPGQRIIPVFIFELASLDSLVMDDAKLAVSFPDMVIGVRTHGGTGLSGFSCGKRQVPINSADILRPVLSAILQTGWGVPDTSLSWTSAVGVQYDYTWSVGNTPFGFLSSKTGLSFSQRDVALRNLVLAHFQAVTQQANTILGGFNKASNTGHIHCALKSDLLDMYFARVNVLMHKLERVAAQLSILKFDSAWYYVRSAKHDVRALNDLASRSAGEMVAFVKCEGKRGGVRFWWLGLVGIGCGAGVWILRWLKPEKSDRYKY